MKKYKVLFADLDGTLIDTVSGDTFPKGIWDMRIRFDVFDAIKELKPQCVLIVTNQGGIEKGFVNQQNFKAKIEYVGRCISEYCGCKCYGTYCISNDKSDPYRKPNPMMLERLTKLHVGNDFDYIKSVSLMIGDASGKEGQFSDSDKKTAENFGIDYLDVKDFVKKINNERDIEERIEEAANNMYENNTFAYKSFIDGACYALSHQWISVEEALPEANEHVLTFIGGVPVVAKGYHVRARIRGIFHWMPIPKFEPYKTE